MLIVMEILKKKNIESDGCWWIHCYLFGVEIQGHEI